jgi:hypothetical protein
VRWNGPPAAGDLDGDGAPEIVLTGPRGLYAFRGDGSVLQQHDPAYGLLTPLARCHLAPVLLPALRSASSPDAQVLACVIEERGETARLRLLDGAGTDAAPPLDLGREEFLSPPLWIGNQLLLVQSGKDGAAPALIVVAWGDFPPTLSFPVPHSFDLEIAPGPATLWAQFEPVRTLVVLTGPQRTVTLWRPGYTFKLDDLQQVVWPGTGRVRSPVGPGLSYVGEGLTGRAVLGGQPRIGWPLRPQPAIAPPESLVAPQPLEVIRPGDALRSDILFQSRDGRLYLYSSEGQLQPGYPLPGPGRVAGTPLLADLDGDGECELAAVGTFERVQGVGDDGWELVTEAVSQLATWEGVGPCQEGGWPMWRGSAWRSGHPRLPAVAPEPGHGLVAGSHICYPSPLRGDMLHVRGEAYRAGTAKVTVYDLEGEEVAAAGPSAVLDSVPFEIMLPLRGVASGMYICRLEYRSTEGASQTSIKSFAVVH